MKMKNCSLGNARLGSSVKSYALMSLREKNDKLLNVIDERLEFSGVCADTDRN